MFASWAKEKLQATGWAVVSLSPGACWEVASSTSPAQHSGHTAIAPTARPPARSPGCADSCGAVFDRKGPAFVGQPHVGLRAAGAFPQSVVPAVRFGRSAPLVCGCKRGGHASSVTSREGGGPFPVFTLQPPILVSEFVQEAVRESLPCKPPMVPHPGCLSLLVPGLLTKAPDDCSALPQARAGACGGWGSLRRTVPWWPTCGLTEGTSWGCLPCRWVIWA